MNTVDPNVSTHYSRFTTHYLLLTTHDRLHTTYYVLLTVDYFLLSTFHLLLTTYHLQFTTYYFPLTTCNRIMTVDPKGPTCTTASFLKAIAGLSSERKWDCSIVEHRRNVGFISSSAWCMWKVGVWVWVRVRVRV